MTKQPLLVVTLSRWKVEPVNTVFNLCPITAKFVIQVAVEKIKKTHQPKSSQEVMQPTPSRKYRLVDLYEVVPQGNEHTEL